MPIKKTLTPNHTVTTIEAMASYVQGIPTEELDALRAPLTPREAWRHFRFAGKFQTVSTWRKLLGLGSGHQNEYERALELRARQVEHAGRLACTGTCGLCVRAVDGYAYTADGRTVSLGELQTSCETDRCTEVGLQAVEQLHKTAEQDAQAVLDRLNNSPMPARLQ